MACAVCGMTMQNLGVEGRRLFWCSWCGTLKDGAVETLPPEPPAWIRHLIQAAGIDRPPAADPGQTRTTSTPFNVLAVVRQVDDEHPTIALSAETPSGRRIL